VTDRQIRLSTPNLPAIPSPRVGDPTLQRTHDAVREVIETIRGTRGNQLDRAVFVRDLVATGLLSFNASSGTIGVGPSIDTTPDAVTDTSTPPLLTNIVATAGFTYVLLTWNDPQYKPLAYYEVHRLKVNDPTASPGYTPDDARITLSESSQYNALLANPSRTPVQTVLMNALGVLDTKTGEYDYAKSAYLLYPNDQALEDAYIAAGTALKAARLAVATAQSNNVASAAHIGSTPSPVYSDPVDSGATYLYWVRAVSTSGIVGPFNAVGVTATTQPDISGVIDELTSEVNRGVVTDLIFNGLDNPANGLSLLENLTDLQNIAEDAQQNASDALAATVAGIPPAIWEAINALYNRLASSVLGTVVESYEQTVDINTLGDRVASAETTLLNAQTDVGSLSGRIDTYTTQFDTQFAEVNVAVSALATADAAFATEITALEGAVYDPVTGVLASHGRIDDVLDLAVSADSALLTSLTQLNARVGATQGQIADILSLQISPTSALASRLTDLQLTLDSASGSVQDLLSLSISPDSALAQRLTAFEVQFAATTARIQDVLELNVDADSVLARALRTLEGAVATATGTVTDLSQLLVEADRVNALKVARLEGAIDATKGSIEEILDLRVSPTSVLGTKLTAIEAATLDASGKVSDVLSLKIDPGTVLAGKLTELEAQTDYASGAVSDMLSLRFTSDAIKDSAYANALQSFELQLDNLESTVQTYTYNVLNDFTDDYGNLTDPVARAGWGVRIEQSVSGVPYVTGFGINQDIYLDSQGVPQAFSEFVVAADRFAIVDPSNPDATKNSPFIVGPDPDDPTAPQRVWIRDAMISRAAIESLTAGVVVADMVRAGAFIQTANLYTPTINIGTWELTSGADPMKPQSWVYNPASGRQGNFSVDASGIMHATGAVLQSALIRDANNNIILDAGNGVYSSALLNDSLYLQAVNGQLTLSGTTNANNSAITLDKFGARALAGANVNDWNATDTTALTLVPTSLASFFHVRLDKTNRHVYLTLRNVAAAGTTNVKFQLEVVGTTVTDPVTAPFVTSQLEAGEVPTWTTTPLAFASATGVQIAPNGVVIDSASGWGLTTGVDQLRFTTAKLDGSVEFRLKITQFSRTNASDRRMIVLGDSVAIAEFATAPLEFWFSPRDGADYDALLLKNGPADADATRGAPSGTLVGGTNAELISAAVADFNASNNRNATGIAAPTIPTDDTAVDHTINTDGSADVSFEWAWSGTEAAIDGFMVYVRQAAGTGAYTFGATPAEETIYQVPAVKRAFVLFGVPANKFYHFAVRAFRKTDPDVAGGLVQSTLVRTTFSNEVNGYQPSSAVAFAGNITGTINGTVNANQVNVWANISGTGRPANNATVGADWNTNLSNIPIESISNSYSIVGINLIPNSELAVAQAPWTLGWVQNGGTDITVARDIAGDSWRPTGGHNVGLRRFGNALTGAIDLRINDNSRIPVVQSTRYELSGYVASHRCDASITVWFYDAAGDYITETGATPARSGGGTNLASWARPYLFVTSPANARTALVGIRVYAVDAGQTDGYAWVTKMHFGEASANQTAPSPWGPASYTGIDQLGYTGDLNATYGAPAGTLVGGTLAETIAAAVQDFNAANNRDGSPVTAPVVPGGGVAVDHTVNTDGSANISFEWSYGGSEASIDGFMVYVKVADATGAYSWDAPETETVYQVPANKRAFVVFSASVDKFYHFSVMAYRKVDEDITAAGVLYSTRAVLTYSGTVEGQENTGYRPSSTVAFAGNVTGTVNNIPVSNVNVWENITSSGGNKPVNGATKNNIYRQTEAPTGGTYTTGDLWIDTDAAPTTVSQWNGAAWSVIGNYTTNTSQLTDGANLGGTATWSGVTGTGKPADFATRNNIYRQTTAPTGGTYTTGDLWIDTDAVPTTVSQWDGASWSLIGNYTTNTSQLADGANLGGTAVWTGVTGTGKPSDNATRNLIYRQAAAPTGGTYTTGDLWYDTDANPTVLYSWSGTAWVATANNVTNTNQVTDGANLGGTAVWSGVSGTGRPADDATKNIIYRQTTAPTGGTYTTGDLWYDTDANPIVLYSWTGSAWTVVANNVTNTNQVTDGANLGGTATWSLISGTGKPADNATKNIVTRSASEPASPTAGDIWIDTSVTPNLVKVRIGTTWEISANYLTAGTELSDYNALSNANITLNSDGSLAGAGGGTAAPFEPYHAAMWDFRGTVGPWGGVNSTVSFGADALIQTGTATTNPYVRILHGGVSISGAIFNKVRVKYRRTVGTAASWKGHVYYSTAAHTGFTASYRKIIASPVDVITNGQWYISEWDMEALSAGGTDWVDSVITGLRVDLTSGANETWEIDWVIVGRYGAGEWTFNTVNPSNPVTSTNIGTYIAQLAVGTLNIGANTVTVPNSATSSTQQTLNTTTWTDLLTVSFTVPSVGLSSIDNNVPIILSWAVEADIQNSGAAVRQWQVLKDGASIYVSNANLLDTEQFCSGVIKDSVNAGTAATFKLQGKGVGGVPVYQKSMWVIAARR
jgi:hypothetical protein